MERTIKSVELPGGVKLPYVEQGNPSGAPVLFLHAIADSWRAFEPVLPHLPDSIHALVPTQRGHGDASRPEADYTPRAFAHDAAAFLDAVGLDATFVVGGSSGGVIARRFALDHPARTLGLVLAGSPFSLRDKPGVQAMWDSTFSKLADPIDPSFVRDFVAGTLARRIPEELFETIVRENLKVPARVWRATMEGLLSDGSSAELHAIKAPTLILWGDQDAVLPRSDQEALRHAIPHARFIAYPGAGHVFYWEDPSRFAGDLVAFIKELGG